MKNFVFWDVTLCGSCEKRRFGGTYRLRSVLQLLVTLNVIPISDYFHLDVEGDMFL
jgi:hypothetical protein